MNEQAVWFDSLPSGYRWANSGGTTIGGANGHHIAANDGKSGSLCGRYAPEEPPPPRSQYSRICGSCRRVLAARELGRG